MATLPHAGTKQAVISFRCDREFKKAVDGALVQRELSLQAAATEALARFLQLPAPHNAAETKAANNKQLTEEVCQRAQ